MEIPLLTPYDVELRVSQLNQTQYGTYCTLLVYKDARCDMRYLDECFGSLNWKRSHEVINGNLFCTVSVWDTDKGQWISKQDVGVESNTEAVKGACSDSFKRACVNLGIGRELYDAPVIRFKLEDKEVAIGSNGKPKTYSKFIVTRMAYDKDKHCYTTFEVVDGNGKVRFSLDQKENSLPIAPANNVVAEQPKHTAGGSNGLSALNNMCSECGGQITSLRVAEFSTKRFGRPLCFSCQKAYAA